MKIVADDSNEQVEVDPEKQNEVILPPPVSMVSIVLSLVSPWTLLASMLRLAQPQLKIRTVKYY